MILILCIIMGWVIGTIPALVIFKCSKSVHQLDVGVMAFWWPFALPVFLLVNGFDEITKYINIIADYIVSKICPNKQ